MNAPRHPSDDHPENRSYRSTGNSTDRNSFIDKLKKPVVFIPIILLLLLLGLYLYKESQLRDARERAAQEQAAILDRANQRISTNTKYLLQVLTKPLSWALRTSMLSGNVEQVDQYLFQFVQEDKFSLVLVADEKGKIISSTDQNYTGSAFSDHFKTEYLTADATVVDDENPERVVVASPIMGLNSRLGTLLAIYLPGKPLQQQEVVEQELR